MALYVECGGLTDEEKKARNELIYIFNPCLKFLFDQYPQFKQYAYNSCRQTAIFSTAFLSEIMAGYSFQLYEGNFSDILHGQKVEYAHAFAIGQNGTRRILVDVSRTERKLLFHLLPDNGIVAYPKVEGYMFLTMSSFGKQDWRELLMSKMPEFLTGMRPIEVCVKATELACNLKAKTKGEQLTFAEKIYNKTTKIGDEFL